MFLSFRDLNLKSLKENPQDWKVFWPKTTCPLKITQASAFIIDGMCNITIILGVRSWRKQAW